MKDLNLTSGHWWRWTRYEISDGYIRPAPRARLQRYDPWRDWLQTRPPAKSSNQQVSHQTPYQALLGILEELEYVAPKDEPLDFSPVEVDMMLAPLTAESEAKLLGWSARYGLLGILPHRVVQVTLAPGTEVQVQYTKIGAGWFQSDRPIVAGRLAVTPRVVVMPLRGAGPMTASLSFWSRFFPDVPPDQRDTFQYPLPTTNEFWDRYAEPVSEFLSGMRALRELHQAIRLFQDTSASARPLQRMQDALLSRHLTAEGLIGGVAMALKWNRERQVEIKWTASSLLGSLAVMMLQDLTYGRALLCPGCGRPFVSGAYQARYCSVRCRWATQKRESRS